MLGDEDDFVDEGEFEQEIQQARYTRKHSFECDLGETGFIIIDDAVIDRV